MSAPQTARARARAELTREILASARRQLETEGAPAISLRAVARELGMVSSAVYRYFASRDELLTALIIEAYEAVGEAAEEADATVDDRADHQGRWLAMGRGVRRWAVAHPSEYALVYGSPVPGYRAPADTIGPAGRVIAVLCRLIVDATTARPARKRTALPIPPEIVPDATRIRDAAMPGVPLDVAAAGLVAWTELFGWISFELFGHMVGVVENYPEFFDHALRTTGRLFLP